MAVEEAIHARSTTPATMIPITTTLLGAPEDFVSLIDSLPTEDHYTSLGSILLPILLTILSMFRITYNKLRISSQSRDDKHNAVLEAISLKCNSTCSSCRIHPGIDSHIGCFLSSCLGRNRSGTITRWGCLKWSPRYPLAFWDVIKKIEEKQLSDRQLCQVVGNTQQSPIHFHLFHPS